MTEDLTPHEKLMADYLERLDCPFDIRVRYNECRPPEPTVEHIDLVLKSKGSKVRQWLFTKLLQLTFWLGKDVMCDIKL